MKNVTETSAILCCQIDTFKVTSSYLFFKINVNDVTNKKGKEHDSSYSVRIKYRLYR